MLRFLSMLCFAITIISTSLFAEDRPFTFSLEQEKILAEYPEVLSFLYYMTRNRLDINEMAQSYQLDSISDYYSFLIENELIKDQADNQTELLFLNPYGAWSLRNRGKDMPILQALRKKALNKLSQNILEKTVSSIDESSPIWIINTLRLTLQEFQQYKKELSQLCKKYVDLSEHNLQEGVEHAPIWSMQLLDCVDSEMDHLLFDSVKEFPKKEL